MDHRPKTTGILFEQERRIRCAIATERDLAASRTPDRRAEHMARIGMLAMQLPQSRAEALLLSVG